MKHQIWPLIKLVCISVAPICTKKTCCRRRRNWSLSDKLKNVPRSPLKRRRKGRRRRLLDLGHDEDFYVPVHSSSFQFHISCPYFQFIPVTPFMPMLICWRLLDIAQEQRKKEQAAAEAAKRQQEKKEEQSLRYRNWNRSARNKQRDSGTPTWHLNGEHDITFYNGGIKQQKMWTVTSTQLFRDTDLNGRPHWLRKLMVFMFLSWQAVHKESSES